MKIKPATKIDKDQTLEISYYNSDKVLLYQITSNKRDEKYFLYRYEEGKIVSVQEGKGSPRPLQEEIYNEMPSLR